MTATEFGFEPVPNQPYRIPDDALVHGTLLRRLPCNDCDERVPDDGTAYWTLHDDGDASIICQSCLDDRIALRDALQRHAEQTAP